MGQTRGPVTLLNVTSELLGGRLLVVYLDF